MFELWNRLKSKEIDMRQNGRYIEFYKKHSRIMFKIDLANNCEIIKITRSTDEEERNWSMRSFNNFFNAKITTNDEKLANMFQYAEWVCNVNQSSVKLHDILYRFRVPAAQKFEKWLAIGTHFNKRGWGWGNEDQETSVSINFEPSDVSREIRNYIAAKTWTITKLNRICRDFHDPYDQDTTDKIFKELTDHPEYEDAFQYILSGGSGGIVDRFTGDVIHRLIGLINEFNLDVPRLMYYMNYLYNCEGVCLAGELDHYEDYLTLELEKQNGRKNKMYKFPRYFMSAVHTHKNLALKHNLADQMEVDDGYVYQNEYLEYQDDKFKFVIPHSAADVHDEAYQQGHCLETRFLNHLRDGDTGVVFMRHLDEPEKALITIEVRNRRVRQMCIGNNNRVPEEYRPYIYNWAEAVGISIDSDSWSVMLDV